MRPTFLDTEAQRRTVTSVVALTANTSLASEHHDCQLPDSHQNDESSISQIIDLLDTSTYQLLYRSRATSLPRACYALAADLASMRQAKTTKWSCCRVVRRRS
jgi:hypothetical protein